MKLEVGKFYRTRDGQKAGPLTRPDTADGYDAEWVFVAPLNGRETVWRADGTEHWREGVTSPSDLIAEWLDDCQTILKECLTDKDWGAGLEPTEDGTAYRIPHLPEGTKFEFIPTGILASAFNAVRQFHTTFRQPAPERPTMLTPERVKARADWSAEEVQEFRDATTLTEQVDSALDRIYFALGDLVEMGIEPSALFDLVQGANMAKVWPDGRPHFREDGKVIKPEGWVSPDAAIEAEIARRGAITACVDESVEVREK